MPSELVLGRVRRTDRWFHPVPSSRHVTLTGAFFQEVWNFEWFGFFFQITQLYCARKRVNRRSLPAVVAAGLYETVVINLQCRFLALKSENDWGPQKPATKIIISAAWWLESAMICHCWSVAWADSDSCTLQKTTSSSLIPPIPSTLSQGGAFFHLSLHCCGHFSSKY